MAEAHNKAHVGVEATMVQFRTNGFCTVRAGQLAKRLKSKCVKCRYLDRPLMSQRMGQRKMEFLESPKVWQQVEIDLHGPFNCRGDRNPRTTVKIWGAVIQDVYPVQYMPMSFGITLHRR